MFNGVSFLEISEQRLRSAALAADYTVVCVASATDITPSEQDFSVLIDDPVCGGPVAGLLAALRHAMLIGADALVFQPVDMPCLTADLLVGLRSRAVRQGAIAIASSVDTKNADLNNMVWTLGAIPASMFHEVEQRILQLTTQEDARPHSSPGLRAVFAHLHVRAVPLADAFLRNVNTLDELLAIRQELPPAT